MNPSPFSNFQQHFAQVSPAPIEGFWFTLELQPDLFAPQSFSVGVVVQTKGGGVYCRILEDLTKLKHLYGHNFPEAMVGHVLSKAEETIRQAEQNQFDLSSLSHIGHEMDFGTDNLKLSKPMFTSGKNIDDIVNRLYENVVVLEPGFDLDESLWEGQVLLCAG